MYLIVGLGNPEPEYSYTRHNIGFDVINMLSEKYNIKVNKNKHSSLYGDGIIANEKVILCKPQTYMNLSGKAVREISDFYKIEISKIIIVYDDIDIKTGIVKIRTKGGPGTHNGMKSVVYELNSKEFPRVRVGTGIPEKGSNLIEYVIGKLNKDKYSELENGIELGVKSIEAILEKGIGNAMNIIN